MNFQRLILVLLQRLSPIYVATVLWWLTDYLAIMLGGVALSVVLAVGWPLAQPFLAVLYEEVLQQRGEVQAQRHDAWLQRVLFFLNAYKSVVAKYPPALLVTSGPVLSAQLTLLADAMQQLNRRLQPHADDPFPTSQTHDAYALVQGTAFNARELRDWRLPQCESWATHLCTALTGRSIPGLQQAVQHFVAGHARRTWESCLAAAEQALDEEVAQTLRQWSCLYKARANPAIGQRLATLLRLDAINRQANLKPYLSARPVACTPEEVREVMAYIRYEPVASRLLMLLEEALRPEVPGVSAPAASDSSLRSEQQAVPRA